MVTSQAAQKEDATETRLSPLRTLTAQKSCSAVKAGPPSADVPDAARVAEPLCSRLCGRCRMASGESRRRRGTRPRRPGRTAAREKSRAPLEANWAPKSGVQACGIWRGVALTAMRQPTRKGPWRLAAGLMQAGVGTAGGQEGRTNEASGETWTPSAAVQQAGGGVAERQVEYEQKRTVKSRKGKNPGSFKAGRWCPRCQKRNSLAAPAEARRVTARTGRRFPRARPTGQGFRGAGSSQGVLERPRRVDAPSHVPPRHSRREGWLSAFRICVRLHSVRATRHTLNSPLRKARITASGQPSTVTHRIPFLQFARTPIACQHHGSWYEA